VRVPLALSVTCVIVTSSFASCTLPAGEPCCVDDLSCNEGARCFESRCAPLCDDDSQCDEGATCLSEGVCRAQVVQPPPCSDDAAQNGGAP
jgi:hypothetical protein